jgi:AraC-like DNA-binding protein/DNA-binding response OmpR family regulator
MIVDDEPVFQDYIRSLLPWEDEGFALFPPVYNGEEARRLMLENPADIVILDVFMPGENGVTLSRYIAEAYPKTAILAISSHDDYDYVREILKNGAHDYILKHRLGRETLDHALRGITAKLSRQGPAPSSAAQDRRERVMLWLFNGSRCPFSPEKDRIALTLARLPREFSLPEQFRAIIVPGILSLIESSGAGDVEISALFKEPDVFISCFNFHDTVSEKRMLSFLSLQDERIRNTVRLIYNLEYFRREAPLLVSPAAMPGQIRRMLASLSWDPAAYGSGGTGLTLSLARKNIFTALLEQGNRAGAEFLLHRIFGSMPQEDRGARLSTARDIAALLAAFIRERNLRTPLENHVLLEWIQGKSPGECEEYFKKLFRRVIAEIEADRRAGDNPVISDHVREAGDYILEHYASDLSLERAASALKISPSYLSRLYKRETGFSFVDGLNQVRVDAAKAALLDGMNLKETASLCGFRYYNYFIKVFKDHTGATPADFMRSPV